MSTDTTIRTQQTEPVYTGLDLDAFSYEKRAIQQNRDTSFKLPKDFVHHYRDNRTPNFGYNGLGEFVYLDKYARLKDDGTKEQWFETIERVVNGVYTLQKRHIIANHLGWNERKAVASAKEMYERMYSMKFLPPGRGLWMMGTPFVDQKGSAALQNCAFISTKDIDVYFTEPFCYMMEASMLGVGVGFDVEGADKVKISRPTNHTFTHRVKDSREGWTYSLQLLLSSYISDSNGSPSFDYSDVRPYGSPIKGFGGIASGPAPLEQLHRDVRRILDAHDGRNLSARGIADIMNMIGRCVVAGNVRRSAQLILGPSDSEEYLSLKDYSWDESTKSWTGPSKERADWGWASNNSVKASVGIDYSEIARRISANGEPGIVWFDNIRNNGRMGESKVDRAVGVNPCSEQPLESSEMCTLVEVFPNHHEDIADFQRTLKFAYMYGKTVTLLNTHWTESNRVMLRNRRIGLSLTGIAQFLGKHGLQSLKTWCNEGYKTVQYYDRVYSDWLCVPASIRTTTVKPSGTVSIVAGATAGVHFPESRFCIRRIRLSKGSSIVAQLRAAGYNVEDDVVDTSSVVVEFPIDYGEGVRTVDEVSMWEQLSLAAFLQEHWSDNAVSCTIGFLPEEVSEIRHALEYFQYRLKTISFMPRKAGKKYAQPPIEPITRERYNELLSNIRVGSNLSMNKDAAGSKFCENDSCEL